LDILLVDIVGLDALCTESFETYHQKLTESRDRRDVQ